jgi:hypothetical protein
MTSAGVCACVCVLCVCVCVREMGENDGSLHFPLHQASFSCPHPSRQALSLEARLEEAARKLHEARRQSELSDQRAEKLSRDSEAQLTDANRWGGVGVLAGRERTHSCLHACMGELVGFVGRRPEPEPELHPAAPRPGC